MPRICWNIWWKLVGDWSWCDNSSVESHDESCRVSLLYVVNMCASKQPDRSEDAPIRWIVGVYLNLLEVCCMGALMVRRFSQVRVLRARRDVSSRKCEGFTKHAATCICSNRGSRYRCVHHLLCSCPAHTTYWGSPCSDGPAIRGERYADISTRTEDDCHLRDLTGDSLHDAVLHAHYVAGRHPATKKKKKRFICAGH